ncbi:MAG: hypothetical protein HY304_04615 [candidate division Zixibacteria bacterium]|nr:hypothetical protein [candidate division Zixibacteria bacterium]
MVYARAYDFGTRENSRGITVDGSGNVISAGGYNIGNNSDDALVVKFDAGGSVLWARTWSRALENGYQVTCDASGNIYTFGATYAPWYAFVSKYDPAGNRLWTQGWSRGGTGQAFTGVVDASGNIYVAGYEGEDADLIVFKLDNAGNLIWDRVWATAGNDRAAGITLAAGAVYVCGLTSSPGDVDRNALILKIDTNGNLIWQRTWGGIGNDQAAGVAADAQGNVFVSGLTESFGSGASDALLLEYTASGALISQKAWGGTGTDGAEGVSISADGRIYLAGDAPNNAGSWQNVVGSSADPGVPLVAAGGTVSPLSGTDGSPTVTETSFAGTVDAGGGGQDALVLALGSCSADFVTCPFDPQDVDCNGIVDILDVVKTINVAFRGQPATSPCCRFQ